MKKKNKFLIASGLGIAAGAAIFSYLKKKRGGSDSLLEDHEDEMYLDFSPATSISYDDAEKIAIDAARDKLGKGASVVSASDNKTLAVTLAGDSRHCYLFGAVSDNLSVNSETLLLYVDAVTGEVLESDSTN